MVNTNEKFAKSGSATAQCRIRGVREGIEPVAVDVGRRSSDGVRDDVLVVVRRGSLKVGDTVRFVPEVDGLATECDLLCTGEGRLWDCVSRVGVGVFMWVGVGRTENVSE